MKLIADSSGRLTAAKLFRPNTVFDVTRQSDGSIRIVKAVKQNVPLVNVKRNKNASGQS
jgi:hypothetical protein